MSPPDFMVYFFGCWREAGHYLWRPGMTRVSLQDCRKLGPLWPHIDGAFMPKTPGVWSHGLFDGWTYLSSVDNTVDTRPGSHATFLVRGMYSEEGAFMIVRRAFPEVCERVGIR